MRMQRLLVLGLAAALAASCSRRPVGAVDLGAFVAGDATAPVDAKAPRDGIRPPRDGFRVDGPGCGNGACEPVLGESCASCPADCGSLFRLAVFDSRLLR